MVSLPINSAGELNNVTIISFRGDYFFHALLFVPWAFFRAGFRMNVWAWSALGLVFAAGSEGLQYLLPYRAYNINDLVSNMLGIVLGLLLCMLFITFVKPKPQQTG